jgi:hypothetical protein
MMITTRPHPLLGGSLGAMLTLACGGEGTGDGAALGEEGREEQASSTLAALSMPPFASCPEPELFEPGSFSLPEQHEYRVAFTPDGTTAFFGRSDEFFPESRQAALYMSERVAGSWSTPVVAPFSGVYPDLDPFVSSDGQRLYSRPSALWTASRERTRTSGWSSARGRAGASRRISDRA